MQNLARLSLALVSLAGLSTLALADDTKPPVGDKTKPPVGEKPTGDKTGAPTMTEMPKPPADIAAVAKSMGGTWKCTGTAMGMDSKEVPMKATMKNKVDLDGWWISTSFAETKKMGFKFTSFTTFDAKTKKWTRQMFDNMGGHETTETSGMANNKMVWEGTTVGAMGTMKSRHNEEATSAKEVHMTGEYSADGKAWMKAYDMVCKK